MRIFVVKEEFLVKTMKITFIVSRARFKPRISTMGLNLVGLAELFSMGTGFGDNKSNDEI